MSEIKDSMENAF